MDEIDRRIESIVEKMKGFVDRDDDISCGTFPPVWDKPFSIEAVEKFERNHHITLPVDYKRFITTFAASGTQPFYGLISLLEQKDIKVNVDAQFGYSFSSPLNIFELSDEEYDELFEKEEKNPDKGFLILSHEGCGMYSILIVNSYEEQTYGKVWYYDLANDAGIFPLKKPGTNEPVSFLDWFEYYVDRTLRLEKNEFFSFGDLIGEID